jgi:hypothetical protein
MGMKRVRVWRKNANISSLRAMWLDWQSVDILSSLHSEVQLGAANACFHLLRLLRLLHLYDKLKVED